MLSASGSFCYAGYELFQGFDVTDVEHFYDTTTEMFLESTFNNVSKSFQISTQPQENATTPILKVENTENLTRPTPSLTMTPNSNSWTIVENATYGDPIEPTSLIPTKFDCPEDENPSNIGPYEVPTKRDLVLFTRNLLLDSFSSYNKEAFFLLKDIRAATKATSSIEKKCEGNKMAYRQCVKRVSSQCQQFTKDLVKELQLQKQEITELTQGHICDLTKMKKDPIIILKSLEQEKLSLQFALPGFLRLLSACSLPCVQSPLTSRAYKIKPLRHMTDQDLVVKYFHTRKNYVELIKDSRHKSTANSN